MITGGTIVQIFNEIDTNLDKLVMSQKQIKRFFDKYSNWLYQHEGYATLFLAKENTKYFVVSLSFDSLKWHVCTKPFNNSYIWFDIHRCRVVSPRLI
jgi:hypothetical protein